MNDSTKTKLLLLTIFASILPLLFNLFSVDFSSQATNLTLLQLESQTFNKDQQFYALSGALHHALFEWTAVTIAIIGGVSAFIHFYRHRDISVPIIGLAILCAGFTDAFHTLAATRIISANVPNSDFIPFTWAFSRIFNATIMIIGIFISLWLSRSPAVTKNIEAKIGNNAEHKNKLFNVGNVNLRQSTLLTFISLSFITFAISAVFIAATSQNLPQTTFSNAFITRPYDVVPLALFVFSASLVWLWYKKKFSLLKFALLLSIIPEIATQLHMSFGSTALFDNHFNIAHFLKIVAYSIITFGLLASLSQGSIVKKPHLSFEVDGTRKPDTSTNNVNESKKKKWQQGHTEKLLDIGIAKYPQSLVISGSIFALAIIITLLVSSIYNIDTQRLAKEQRLNELASHGDFIELFTQEFFKNTKIDKLQASSTQIDQAPIKPFVEDDVTSKQLQLRLNLFLKKLKLTKFSDKHIYLADNTGDIIYQSSASNKNHTINTDSNFINTTKETPLKLQQLFPGIAQAIATNKQIFQLGLQTSFFKDDLSNSEIIGHYRTIKLNSINEQVLLRLFIKLDDQTLLSKITTFRNRSLLIGFALAIVALAIALLISRKLSTSLQIITGELVRYSHTGKVKKLPVNAQDESGVLARSFHNLLVTKTEQDKALKQQKNALDEHAIVSIADVRGNIKYTNEKFSQVSGYSKEELMGQNHRILNSGSHDRAFFKEMYLTISSGRAWQGEICNKAKNGRLYWVNTTIVPFLNAKGKPESYISIRTDITADKLNSQKLFQAKESLSNQVSKLKQANTELDQFAYVASHDLKSPLNGISQLVSWLEEDCYHVLPDDSKEHLILLKSRSKRMIALLNDLLEYSRAGRKDYLVEEINLAQLTTGIFDLQGNRDGFTCEADDIDMVLPKVPFELVIRNVISNAIKHHDKPTGHITVSLTTSSDNYHVRIQDDGPGIPTNLHSKAVEMFQTLQSRDKTEGSGMGLALVKKTVSYHGGSLFIDSNDKRGTGIIITWPMSTDKTLAKGNAITLETELT